MRDIHRRLLLKEIVVELGIDKSWINSLQRKTGIPKHIGTKGERTYFEKGEIEQIKVANVLRLLGFGFNVIKQIYVAEKVILKAPKFQPREYDPDEDPGDSNMCELLFFPRQIPVYAYYNSGDQNLEFLRDMYAEIRKRKDKAIEQMEMLSKKIKNI